MVEEGEGREGVGGVEGRGRGGGGEKEGGIEEGRDGGKGEKEGEETGEDGRGG